MPLIQIAEPTVEPVSVAEVLDSARIDDTAFNAQATIIIKALRKHAEARIGRALITQTMELVLDGFPSGEIDLLLPNVQSITSVKYFDIAGAEQTLASNKYGLDNVTTPNWLIPAYNTTWPDTFSMANALRIQFIVGYGDAGSDVPEDIRLWIIAHAGQALDSSNGLIDQAFRPLPFVDRLLDPYIVYRAF
jgi:uncharacterized phiE125 gp8 family phage protein